VALTAARLSVCLREWAEPLHIFSARLNKCGGMKLFLRRCHALLFPADQHTIRPVAVVVVVVVVVVAVVVVSL
jgi:hypothetical protein